MRIVFYSNRIFFDGDYLTKRGLGGSESALINLSTSWKKEHSADEIIVYNGRVRTNENSNFEGVAYKTVLDFKAECRTFNADVFITLREPDPLMEPYIDSKLFLFHSQDDMNEPGLQTIKSNLYLQKRIDSILAISEHSKKDFINNLPIPVKIIRNGYNHEWIPKEFKKGNGIAVYTSTPFRGLDVLTQCWPEIYNECKLQDITPTLKIFSGMSLYQQPDDPSLMILYNVLRNLSGVIFSNPLPQKELFKELQSANVMLYPNHFLETGCMAVTEALANGCWVVTSNLGALPEQVEDQKNGFLIDGDAHTQEYKKKFIEAAVCALCYIPIPNSESLIFTWKNQMEELRNYIYKLLR